MFQDISGPAETIDPLASPVNLRLGELCRAVEGLLDRCHHPSVIGHQLATLLASAPARSRLDRLLTVCGFEADAAGFFAELVAALEGPTCRDWRSVSVNGVAMPHAILLRVLEVLDPGEALIDISSVQQLEKLLRRQLPAADHAPLQDVLERFPVRLSEHSLRQLRLSGAVADQYLPFVDELSHEGLVNTWVGQFHSGVIERMYHNRVIMVLNMSCPVYCRFCFRKHKDCRQERPPTRADVRRGVDYVASCPEISEVVLTGGDPFMNRATLSCAVESLLEVEHVRCLRLASRSLSYHPALFTQSDGFWLGYLKGAQLEATRRGKRIEIATHFIHPDELSLQSLDLIAELTSSGIAVYVQTPLLGGTNDGGDELVELYQRLRSAGAEMHYIFMPCSPLEGNRAYRSTIETGMRVAAHLRANLSDRAMPHICTATAFGKIDWGVNGWAVEEDPEDQRYLWLRTPYTEKTFSAFTTDLDLSNVARRNAGGTLDARFMVEVGDRRWLRGSHPVDPGSAPLPPLDAARALHETGRFRALQQQLVASDRKRPLRRVHATRVELDCALDDETLDQAIETIHGMQRVTDVVVWSSSADPLQQPQQLAHLLDRLAAVPQVTAIRLRSAAALMSPHQLSEGALEVLTSRNRPGPVNPLRIEVELTVLHRSELTAAHGRLADRLREHGVTVYNTTPLLDGINLDPGAVSGISSACRRHGIEFHNLVVAGDPLQQRWNAVRPVSVSAVIEIASELRRLGSGRELPRYVIQTELGEGDLGLTAEPLEVDPQGRARVRLLTSIVSAAGQVRPWGVLPEDAEVDQDGHPIVAVSGLSC